MWEGSDGKIPAKLNPRVGDKILIVPLGPRDHVLLPTGEGAGRARAHARPGSPQCARATKELGGSGVSPRRDSARS